MKHLRYLLALLSILAVLSPLSVFARVKNEHSVDIPDTVQVGGTQLKPGNYKVNRKSSPRHTGDFLAGWEDCGDGPSDAEDEPSDSRRDRD